VTLGDGSTLRLGDGEATETTLPDGAALRVSRSGTEFLVETRTADTTSQLSGLPDPARTTAQMTDEGLSSTRSISSTSIGVATDGSKNATAVGVSAAAALVCLSDIRGLVMGVLLVAVVWRL
jgi:hypothetical protein